MQLTGVRRLAMRKVRAESRKTRIVMKLAKRKRGIVRKIRYVPKHCHNLTKFSLSPV